MLSSLHRCDLDDFNGVRDASSRSAILSLALALALVPITALFAGLTIGLLGLDVTALSILEHAGEDKEREYARKILPVRKQVRFGCVLGRNHAYIQCIEPHSLLY